jgi:hypothetical protein
MLISQFANYQISFILKKTRVIKVRYFCDVFGDKILIINQLQKFHFERNSEIFLHRHKY